MPNVVEAEMSCKWRNDWRAREQKWFLTAFVYDPFLIFPLPLSKIGETSGDESFTSLHSQNVSRGSSRGGRNKPIYISAGVRMEYFHERNSYNYYLVTTLSSTFSRPITWGGGTERNQVVELYLPFIRNSQSPKICYFSGFDYGADGKLKFWFFVAVCLVKPRHSWSCWSP